jgi:hypothetical protein
MVVTVRNGRMRDYCNRAAGLAAAGLAPEPCDARVSRRQGPDGVTTSVRSATSV